MKQEEKEVTSRFYSLICTAKLDQSIEHQNLF